MSECTLIERLPTPQEYNDLRQSVGWRTHRQDAIEKGMPNTLYCVCAYADEELVGMARIIGDAGLAYYIQDVIVIPTYQRQGIGTQIMDQIMRYLHQALNQKATIGLMAAPGKEAFYEKYGFARLPNEVRGAGMTILWES
jgi:GNAT superfamily N-acetyltransferase